MAGRPDGRRERARLLRQLRGTRQYVVAAEMEAPGAPRAHAVGAIGPSTSQHGMSLCGMPAEVLVIVPDLEWNQIEESSRCQLCQSAWPAES